MSILGVEKNPDLAEVGILMYRALLPDGDWETAMLAALKEMSPFWRRAVEDGDELIGTVLDFQLVQLLAEPQAGEKRDTGLYDIVDAQFIGKPHSKVIFVRMAHVTNFRKLFLRDLYERANAEQAAEK